ncbi:unnamed protein product [Protopolystoma xenopodis]|uniref:Uncharacterized protein n=1 Tax=Protopolystoma xenopodis TaxID=117903 RepID=A0A3S5BX12_9PLAT|nr:unnamed protein product [Protopolystoma xenopodis]
MSFIWLVETASTRASVLSLGAQVALFLALWLCGAPHPAPIRAFSFAPYHSLYIPHDLLTTTAHSVACFDTLSSCRAELDLSVNSLDNNTFVHLPSTGRWLGRERVYFSLHFASLFKRIKYGKINFFSPRIHNSALLASVQWQFGTITNRPGWPRVLLESVVGTN